MQPGGQFDMQQLLAQAMSAQQELAAAEVRGQAGNGLVTVTLSGEGEVKAIRIDPKVVDPEDVETLQDLIIGALSDAHDALQELAAQKLGPLAGGLGGLGGGFGGGLGGGPGGLGGPGALGSGPSGLGRPDL